MLPAAWKSLAFALLLALPLASPVGGAQSEDTPGVAIINDDGENELSPPAAGYTGPGQKPYVNFFEGIWFYGQVSATPLTQQQPVNLQGSGEWLVWEDASRGDIFAYNIPAGAGQYLTNDRALQRNVAIDGGVVVWEDYRNSTRADIYAYFLDTGETRRISEGPGNHQDPDIRGDLIVWEDDREGNGDIWGYSLANQTQFPVFVGPDRESDPVIVGDDVYFRTYRFNVWDILGVDLATGEAVQVTSDVGIQGAPFTNGKDLYFVSQFFTAWQLDTWDAEAREVKPTRFRFQDTTRLAISGDHLVAAVRDSLNRQLVAQNLTTFTSTHVSGSLPLTTEPHVDGRTVYLTARTQKGLVLLTVDVSPFAFGKRPELTLVSPRSGSPWTGPVVAEGILTADGSWNEPATFTYRLDDAPPIAVPYTQKWRFTLDPAGVEPGRHTVTIRATYREGPPVERSFQLFIPIPGSTVDVEKAGAEFHAARVVATLNLWFLDNPASYAVIVLVLVLVALLIIRVWLMLKPRRERLVVEYVPPDEA